MFQRLDCVCLHTSDLDKSLAFYTKMGLREAWRLERTTEEGIPWTLVGLDFPDETSSQLTLSTHPERKVIDVEIRVEDVRAAGAVLDHIQHKLQRLGDRRVADSLTSEVAEPPLDDLVPWCEGAKQTRPTGFRQARSGCWKLRSPIRRARPGSTR